MRIEGKLEKWNDERGFGFISPAQGGPPVFVHVSAFSGGTRPALGDQLTFEIEMTEDGRTRAKNVKPRVGHALPSNATRSTPTTSGSSNWVWPVLVLIVLAAFGYYAYSRYERHDTPSAAPEMQPRAHPDLSTTQSLRTKPEAKSPVQTFRCDGRTHCSQMTSCEEATYFLRNCPGVKMDGNNDGVPCEQQWCK